MDQICPTCTVAPLSSPTRSCAGRNAVGRRLSCRLVRRMASSRDPAAERWLAYTALDRAFLACLRVLRADPAACRSSAVSCTRPTRRRVRDDGVRVGLRRGRPTVHRCPNWVTSGLCRCTSECPRCSRKQTSPKTVAKCVKCHEWTSVRWPSSVRLNLCPYCVKT